MQPTVRSNFADTALWVGALETNSDGIAKVKLTLPENLSTWKIRTWAMGRGANVGETAVEVVTTKNLIVRLHLLVRDRTVTLAHLPAELVAPPEASTPEVPAGEISSIDEATRQAVVRAVAAQGGNLSKVAQTLGISRPTLYRKLKLYGIRA